MSFSRRDLFWYCAGVLTVVVAGFLLRALDGSQNSAPAPMHGTPSVASGAAGNAGGGADTGTGAGAGGPESGSGASDAAVGHAAGSSGGPGSMTEALARLESRLATRGGSDSDWELLAQSYEFVGRGDDAKLARTHHLPDSAAAATDAATDASPQPGAKAPSTPDASAGASAGSISMLAGEVQLADGLRKQVADGQTLFIVAKSVDSPGPPLAIFRTVTGQWPLRFTLDDSNAMLPGRNLSSAQHISIEARVSRGGGARPERGDFQSPVSTVDPHAARSLHLIIDHVIG